MTKIGFGGQWVEIFRVGRHTDGYGATNDYDRAFLEQVISNFAANEAPAVVGHPTSNGPAYGWVSSVRLSGDSLEVQFSDCEPEFEELVRQKRYSKRSASFYLNPPKLRHVGFLGAQPPALKGLREIQFNGGDESATVEISFSEEQMNTEKNATPAEERKTFGEWMKEMFGGTPAAPAAPSANFSEADAQRLIEAALAKQKTELTTDFSEKLSAKDTEIKTLSTQVNAMSTGSKRAEIASYVESIPAEKGKHFLKNAGLAEFLEALADADAKDAEKAVAVFSEGGNGAQIETKFSRLEWAKQFLNALPKFISFGETFGSITATKDADKQTDPNSLKAMREEMGLKNGGDK